MHQILQSVKQGCQLCEIILRQGWENPAYLKPLSEETRNKPVCYKVILQQNVEPGLGPIVRLQDKMAGKDGRYAALSYCWGGPQPLTATKSNLQTLISGVEVDKLPQALQDAVHVTRRLGIRYLWIDALCIIQDSPEDKLSEIGKMGTIYRNAVVTIASAYARKASDGFLKVSMDCKLENSCVIPVHLPENPRVGRVTLATRRPQYELYPDALRTRGWAFQEAVLSRRILIFSRYDLQCHCKPQHNKFLNVGNVNRDKTSKLYAFGTKHFDMFDTRHKSHGDGWMSALFLDVDELLATVTSVHYILLDKHVNTVGIDEGGPLWLYYVSGIITYETNEGAFQRLGCFRWDIDQPAEDEYTFGQRRRVKLV
ncbi:hypothetical protein BHE90_009959 [Fusarium euwallaceae]|uniref:Heterokaryon incompatibility domain-containing protein n=1 Tax=Fusarium euwallaceae TaxID=1147111 RepID=A0A430LIP3_9HYPO|nr:hypothetical protein BHE90_009959 [Fusarium euwallaceae]